MRLDLSAGWARGLARGLTKGLAGALAGGVLAGGVLAGCGGDPQTVSRKARVMAKPGAVWGRDLAGGLGLQEWELCSELGGYDCIREAHLITLGGVEPGVLGIDQPLPNAAVSAPIAVDRVATSACAERYRRDQAGLAGGTAVIFGPVLERDSAGHREAVATALIQRVLGRAPIKAELQSLEDLRGALEPVSKDLQRDWAIGACVTVATSTEALFY